MQTVTHSSDYWPLTYLKVSRTSGTSWGEYQSIYSSVVYFHYLALIHFRICYWYYYFNLCSSHNSGVCIEHFKNDCTFHKDTIQISHIPEQREWIITIDIVSSSRVNVNLFYLLIRSELSICSSAGHILRLNCCSARLSLANMENTLKGNGIPAIRLFLLADSLLCAGCVRWNENTGSFGMENRLIFYLNLLAWFVLISFLSFQEGFSQEEGFIGYFRQCWPLV